MCRGSVGLILLCFRFLIVFRDGFEGLSEGNTRVYQNVHLPARHLAEPNTSNLKMGQAPSTLTNPMSKAENNSKVAAAVEDDEPDEW